MFLIGWRESSRALYHNLGKSSLLQIGFGPPLSPGSGVRYHPVKTLILGAAAIAAAMITGCTNTVLFSQSVEEQGLIYYLPKTVVRLEISSYGKVITKAATKNEPAKPEVV